MPTNLRDEVWADAPEYYATANLAEVFTALPASVGAHNVGAYGRDGRRGHRLSWGALSGPPFERRMTRALGTADPYARLLFAFRPSGMQSVPVVIAQLFAPAAGFAAVSLAHMPDGTLGVLLGENGFFGYTLLVDPSAAVVGANQYAHIEWLMKFAGAASEVTVWLNGDPTPVIQETGVDTGVSAWRTASWGMRIFNNIGGYGAQTIDYCDLVAMSSQTDYGTDQIGDAECIWRGALAGNGTHQDSTPSAGADRGEMVNDALEDGDATANLFPGADGAGPRDSYAPDPVVDNGQTVYFDINVAVAKKASAGTALMNGSVRSGGVDVDGDANVALSTDYLHIKTPFQAYGATPLTPASVNATEIGVVIG